MSGPDIAGTCWVGTSGLYIDEILFGSNVTGIDPRLVDTTSDRSLFAHAQRKYLYYCCDGISPSN